MDTATTNFDESTDSSDYDEPAWKSKNRRTARQAVSYSRKNKDKFLDKDKADENRDLYLDLFDEDPNTSICDNQRFERELFSDIKETNKTPTKATRKRATKKKKQQDDENPEFLSKQYQSKLEQQKAKLQEMFEKSSVYQNLQALKDLPLNIEEVDCKGNVVKRYEYYFDFEENKHDIVEVNNDEDASVTASPKRSSDKPVIESDDDDIQNDTVQNAKQLDKPLSKQPSRSADKQTDKTSAKSNSTRNEPKSKRKERDDDGIQKSATKKKRTTTKSNEKQQVNNDKITTTRPTRNLKRKSYVETRDDDVSDEEDARNETPKRKRKTIK